MPVCTFVCVRQTVYLARVVMDLNLSDRKKILYSGQIDR